MAKRENFTTGVGVARYPYLTRPDTGKGRDFKMDAQYKIDLCLPKEGNEELLTMLDERAEAAYQDALGKAKKAADKKKIIKADAYEVEEDDDGDETGNVVLRFKMKAHVEPTNGEPFDQAPALFDVAGKKFEGKSVWGGSECKVNFQVIPYFVASSKQAGVSLRLRAVQIIKLIAGEANASAYGFEAEESEGEEGSEDESGGDNPTSDDF